MNKYENCIKIIKCLYILSTIIICQNTSGIDKLEFFWSCLLNFIYYFDCIKSIKNKNISINKKLYEILLFARTFLTGLVYCIKKQSIWLKNLNYLQNLIFLVLITIF